MLLKEKYGSLALVAGASAGLGAAFSEYLAASGIDLVMVARNREKLGHYAASLSDKFGIRTYPLCCDLSDYDATEKIMKEVEGRDIGILVYNAALSFIGPFEKDTPEHCNRIAVANMVTPLNLVKILGEAMLERKRGAIILMASMAGFQGSGFLTTYASTKAFNRVFAESLWYEWKDRGVDVMACCAGATSTENYLDTNPGSSGFFAPRVTTPAEVVSECLSRLGTTPSFVAGAGNRVATFFMHRLLTRKMAVRIMGDNTRKIYRL
jgi:short-subunit dehydrogenase